MSWPWTATWQRMDETLALAQKAAVTSGGSIEAMACDVTLSEAIKACVDHAMARFGRIDVLVNNVGGSAAGGPGGDERGRVGRANRPQPQKRFFGLQACAAHHGGPRCGGDCQHRLHLWHALDRRGPSGLCRHQGGVIQLGKVVAVQYAKQGIRVNTVVPGQLHTPMVETRLAGQRAGGDVQSLLQARQARIPLPFMGDGRDTARAVLFLASDEARFITGTEIVVDGGMSVRCD
jgi:NAD(P)-dependent dehydrogenase (short-subunit alcohol dehydrogenase family)